MHDSEYKLYIIQETFTVWKTALPFFVKDDKELMDENIFKAFSAKGLYPSRDNILVLGPFEIPKAVE